MSKVLTVERVLLGAIAGLQVTHIAVDIVNERAAERRASQNIVRREETAPVSMARGDNTPTAGSPQGTLYQGGPAFGGHFMAQAVVSGSSAGHMDPVMAVNALMVRAMRDLEQMSTVVCRDEDWRRLGPVPAMDMRERADDYLVLLSVPDQVDPSLLEVELEGRILSISGHAFAESPFSPPVQIFERRLQLPGAVGNPQFARASITNGLLRITLPKAPSVQQAATTDRMRIF